MVKIKFQLPFRIIHLPSQATTGITNHLSDNTFCLFIDYDMVEYSVVKEDVEFLQKNYDLGTALVRISNKDYEKKGKEVVGSFHVIFFTKLLFPEVIKLLELCRCDWKFKQGYKYQQRSWTLRVEVKQGDQVREKPVFYALLNAPTKRQASSGMIKFFSVLDEINLTNKYKNFDNLDEVEVINYVT